MPVEAPCRARDCATIAKRGQRVPLDIDDAGGFKVNDEMKVMGNAQQSLTRTYREILADLPLHWFDRSRAYEPEVAKLLGLFLPGTSQAFLQAKCRIMLVGRETRRWNVVNDKSPFLEVLPCQSYLFFGKAKAMGTQSLGRS